MFCSKTKNGIRRRFGSSSTAEEVIAGADLGGRVFAITGTTSGIGTLTARCLVLAGARVLILNRNKAASEEEIAVLRAEKPDALVEFIHCDLMSIASVERCAEEILAKKCPLHCLILNAGVLTVERQTTADGLEASFGVNHVAHFHLTNLLLPLIRSSAPSKIVILSSDLHAYPGISTSKSAAEKVTELIPTPETNVGGFRLYCRSKMCNVLTGMKLHRDEHENGIDVYIVHPGFIKTSLNREMGFRGKLIHTVAGPFIMKNIPEGAATTLFCATHPDAQGLSGFFWENCWMSEIRLRKSFARDVELQEEMWRRTVGIIDGIVKKL